MSLALPAWLRRPSDRTKDVALGVLVGILVVGSGIGNAVDRGQPLFVVVSVAAMVPFAWRRSRPVVGLAAVLLLGLGVPDSVIVQVAAAFMLFRVAVSRPPPVVAAAAVAYVGTSAVHEMLWRSDDFRSGEVVGTALVCGFTVAFGLTVANRIANVNALQERAERLDRERELMAEQAVSDERVRIARELHDVVAHNVSLMVVQAQALGATVREPAVVDATTGIADLGRQAMTEMHRTLELLRDRDGSTGRAPRPGLANLDSLVEQSRGAGLEVDVEVSGAPRMLHDSLDLSAFRIVQESLTNVRKHASGAPAHVRIAYEGEALDLTIANEAGGVDTAANGDGGGHGITGMRERAAVFGGRLEAGPDAGGGFAVHAVLPYDEVGSS